MKYRRALTIIAIVPFFTLSAQFAPGAGNMGTTAIHKDSAVFVEWALSCQVQRGYIKISDTALTFEGSNRATHGETINATGIADGSVISLGDAGQAILQFETPIANGAGPDFAVFENGFRSQLPPAHYFLELAFVEVSSDGENFVRFPASSNTQSATQLGPFDQVDAAKINNLAGKYEIFYGTPFDLQELMDSNSVDIANITHIKIIDVVGSIAAKYNSTDAYGNIINDPYPTPFSTGGFDLDAVGVINNVKNATDIHENVAKHNISVYPNPATHYLVIEKTCKAPVTIFNASGSIFFKSNSPKEKMNIDIRHWPEGLYFIKTNNKYLQKIIKQ